MRTWGRSSIPLRGTSGHTRHTKIETPPSVDTDRRSEHLRAALSHDIILRDNDIPQVLQSWDNNITDLVSGISLKLPPIWEVNVMCLHLYFSHYSPIEFGPDILSMVF